MDSITLPDDGVIRLVGWPDALADSIGHPVHGEYVEHFWLGILGPTATWLLRRFGDSIRAFPEGCEIDLAPLAQSLGLAFHPGRVNPFSRGFDRLAMFGLVRHVSSRPLQTFAVRGRVPPLSHRQLARLPRQLQESHSDIVAPVTAMVSVRT